MTAQTDYAQLHVAPTTDEGPAKAISESIARGRDAQRRWALAPLQTRVTAVRKVREAVAANADALANSVTFPHRNSPGETLAAEIIPIADACRYLEADAKRVLQPKRFGRRLRPKWLAGVDSELRREPFGLVLIIGASNYPLFLTGIQSLQAIMAGNAVLVKPGTGASAATDAFHKLCLIDNMDPDLFQILPEGTEYAQAAMAQGVDKVVLTGSADTGRAVQSSLAQTLTPATMELSGCDAVFVLAEADLECVAKCLVFGLRFNTSATCIAPRRVFVPAAIHDSLAQRLRVEVHKYVDSKNRQNDVAWQRAADLVGQAITDGAEIVCGGTQNHNGVHSLDGWTILGNAKPQMSLLKTDVFAPILSLIPISTDQPTQFPDAALAADAVCPYALGATVFGRPSDAKRLANRINAGCVVINDMIAPSADPRIPFGGRKASGFGTTRGASGLLEMTQTKAILHQRSRWLPHLDKPTPYDANLLAGFLQMTHSSSIRQRLTGLRAVLKSAWAQWKWRGNNGDATTAHDSNYNNETANRTKE